MVKLIVCRIVPQRRNNTRENLSKLKSLNVSFSRPIKTAINRYKKNSNRGIVHSGSGEQQKIINRRSIRIIK